MLIYLFKNSISILGWDFNSVKWYHPIGVILQLAFFHSCYIFKIYPCRFMNIYFVCFNCCIVYCRTCSSTGSCLDYFKCFICIQTSLYVPLCANVCLWGNLIVCTLSFDSQRHAVLVNQGLSVRPPSQRMYQGPRPWYSDTMSWWNR